MSRDFRMYWSAEVTSTFGSAFTATATSVVAVNTFGASAAQIGFMTAATFAPTVVFGLFAGVFADRMRHPRRILVLTDALAALTVTIVGTGLVFDVASVWWLVALNFALGCLGTVSQPLYFAHLTQIVGGDELLAGRMRLQSGEYGAGVLGRTAAGPAIAVAGGVAAFAIDAVTYLVSIVCLRSLRTQDRRAEAPEPNAVRSVTREAADGFRALRKHRFLRATSGFLIYWSCIFGAVTALTAPFLLRTLQFPIGLYGLLFAFTGIAGLAGSVLGGYLGHRVSLPMLTIGGFSGGIITTMLLPLASGPVAVAITVGILAMALPAMFSAIANIGLVGVISRDIPEYLLGRVIAALKTGTTTAQVTGALLGGVLGDVIGIRQALWLCCLAALAGLLLLVPATRSADRQLAVRV